MKTFAINPGAVLFHPEFDRLNNYEIPVMSPLTEELITINEEGYTILYIMYTNPARTLEQLQELVTICNPQITPERVQAFIEFLEKKEIVNGEESIPAL